MKPAGLAAAWIGAAWLAWGDPGLVAADPSRGERIFGACSVCHDTGGANRTGPGLFRVIGRKAGTAPGFRYSRAMKRSKIVWDENSLDAYLSDPQGLVPGNVMPFPGLSEDRQRKDLIAYLETLK